MGGSGVSERYVSRAAWRLTLGGGRAHSCWVGLRCLGLRCLGLLLLFPPAPLAHVPCWSPLETKSWAGLVVNDKLQRELSDSNDIRQLQFLPPRRWVTWRGEEGLFCSISLCFCGVCCFIFFLLCFFMLLQLSYLCRFEKRQFETKKQCPLFKAGHC